MHLLDGMLRIELRDSCGLGVKIFLNAETAKDAEIFGKWN